ASAGPSRPPTTISASRRDSGYRELLAGCVLRTTMISRHGWAAAAVAAAVSASRTRRSSTEPTRVRASPLATPPALRRSAESALTTSSPLVSHSAITGLSDSLVPRRPDATSTGPATRRLHQRVGSLSTPRRRSARSGPPPGMSVAGEHLVGRARPPFAGPVRERGGSGPRLFERVDHPPTGLHLVRVREQRAVAHQHVEHEPLVRLGA